MKTISREHIPEDFSYYRTGSKVFYEYYKQYSRLLIHRIGTGYEFIRAGKILGNIYSIIAEKIDREPTPELMRSLGMDHGIIFW